MDVVNTTGQDSHFQVSIGGGGHVSQTGKTAPQPVLASRTLLKAHQATQHGPLENAATVTFWVRGEMLSAEVPAGTDTVKLVETSPGKLSVAFDQPLRHQPSRAQAS